MYNKSIYPNLEAELSRYNISKTSLARSLGLSRVSLYKKMRGAPSFTIDELKAIRLTLEIKTNEKFTLDYLFQESV
jgi:DNA-binding phage protein